MSRSTSSIPFIDTAAEVVVTESTNPHILGKRRTIEQLSQGQPCRFLRVHERGTADDGNLIVERGRDGTPGYWFAEGRPVRKFSSN